MKKLLLLAAILLFSLTSKAQVTYCEDMEVIDTVSSTGVPGFTANTSYFVSGLQSMHSSITGPTDTSWLTTVPFSTLGNFFVTFSFNHICKIEFFDNADIEVSNDNGQTWIRLLPDPQANSNCFYLGGSPYTALGNKFSSASYGIWDPANNAAIPDNATWWQPETFDVSGLLGNVASAMIRFRIMDANGNAGAGNYGWLIDDFCIQIAPSETNPPVITLTPPLYDCPYIYSIGPFDINADIQDASGINTATVYYTINAGPLQNVAMSNIGGTAWLGTIPAVSNGDQVCYYLVAIDNSPSANADTLPDAGTYCFTAFNGISFPYYDNFDCSSSLWTPSSLGGSIWELGTPQFGVTTGAYSNPNAWDIDLFSPYINNSTAYLESPVFDFTGQTLVRMTFWQNRNTQANSDGWHIEYSLNNGPWITLGFVGDPLGTNWYTANLPLGGASWDGLSAGWVKSEYELGPTFANQPNVRFRFVFTSDSFTFLDGVSVDDFSLVIPCPLDAGLTQINTPGGAAGSGQSVSPIITVKNYGTTTITTLDACYSINAGAPTCTTLTGLNILPGTISQVTLPAFIVPGASFDFCAWTDLIGDCDHLNDTLCKNVTVVQVLTLPFCDDFEGVNPGWVNVNPVGLSNWELGTPSFGQTSGAHSGVLAWDVDLFSGYLGNSECYLVSPYFDLSGINNPRVSFWHNWSTENSWDGTRLDYSIDGGQTWNVVGTVPDPNGTNWYDNISIISSGLPGWDGNSQTAPFSGNPWLESKYKNMSFLNNQSAVQFRFAFTSDAIIESDGYSIDDFCFSYPTPQDGGVASIVRPCGGAGAGQTISPVVVIENFGSQPLTSFDVCYDYGTGPICHTWTGNLAPGATINDTLAPFVVPGSSFTFCAWTVVIGDGDNLNDTTCCTVNVFPVILLPFCDNFDGTPQGWAVTTPGSGSSWQLGTPNTGQVNGAFSPPNAYAVALSGVYLPNTETHLYSPVFDFTSVINARLSVKMNWNAENSWDGTRIDYTTDFQTWNVLGTVPDPNGINWYDNISLISSGLPGWDGNSTVAPFNGTPWLEAKYDPLTALNGIPAVQFRFVFTSDASVQLENFAIDDFCLKPPFPIDAGVTRIWIPGPVAGAGSQIDTVTVTIKNFGTNTLTNTDIFYSDGTNTYGPYVYAGTPLGPNDTAVVDIPIPFTVPSCLFNFCAWTALIGDQDLTNDTLCKDVVGVPIVTPAYFDNFDVGQSCWASVSPSGGTRWELGTPNFGTTTGAYSSPNSWDINLNSGYTASANAVLYTPVFNLSAVVNAKLSFWQNRDINTFNGDGFYIEYTTNGTTWQTLGVVNDPLGTNWYNAQLGAPTSKPGWNGPSSGQAGVPLWIFSERSINFLSLQPYVQFRFVFKSGTFSAGNGVSIDDFTITAPGPNDIGVVKIIQPFNQEPAGTNVFVVVKVENFGSNAIAFSDIEYQVNAGPIQTTPWNGNMQPGDTLWITLFPQLTIPTGPYSICAWTALVGDTDLSNDSTCNAKVGVPLLSANYFDNFDAGNVGWSPTPVGPPQTGQTMWELGIPAFGVTSSTHSSPACWDVNLTMAYGPNAEAYLYSPYFDFTYPNVTGAVLSFWQNRGLPNFTDGTTLEYTTNFGQTWTTLGAIGTGTNWFNGTQFTVNKPIWLGSSGGWINSSHILPLNIIGQPAVQFRYIFYSDAFTFQDGMSVDDFRIELEFANNAATDSIGTSNPLLMPGPQPVTALIVNKGTNILTTCDVTLEMVGAGIIATEPHVFSPPIPKGGSQWHTFTTPWLAPAGCHNMKIWSSNPNGVSDNFPVDDTTYRIICVFDSLTVTTANDYCNDFESPPQWVTLNSQNYSNATSWELGTPTKNVINSAHSGTNAWVTDLDSAYNDLDQSALFTPVFNVDKNGCYKVSFWHWYDAELYMDGGILEFSMDNGNTWTIIGKYGDPAWYNTYYIYSLAPQVPPLIPGWTGSSGNWVYAEHDVRFPQTGGAILRFRFETDASNYTAFDGWAIDDVCFERLRRSDCPITPSDEELRLTYLGQNYPNPSDGHTSFDYMIPEEGHVEITISDALGQVIVTPESSHKSAGLYTVSVNMAPGVYYYKLRFKDQMLAKRMLIIK